MSALSFVSGLALAGSVWLASAGTVRAQSEAALKDYFEGKTVTLKIDMLATENGIDVYPGSSSPIDFSKYAKRIKDAGTAIHSGDQVLVTKVKVKDKLIEFQLGGGDYAAAGALRAAGAAGAAAPPAGTAGRFAQRERREN